jgi:hypothetical protein
MSLSLQLVLPGHSLRRRLLLECRDTRHNDTIMSVAFFGRYDECLGLLDIYVF